MITWFLFHVYNQCNICFVGRRLVGKMREKYKLDTKNAIRAQNEVAKQRFENGYKLIAAELRMFIKNYSTQILQR